jgi:ApbE superfamily uncharacterized protein (UPF0280 family)
MGPTRARLDARRWHFQHGPIDLVLEAHGDEEAVAAAHERAWHRFATVLDELVAELPALRGEVARAVDLKGAVARRMVAACLPYRDVFITPMAAVAGAVAEEILGELVAGGGIPRAYVNNGGDIALHLEAGQSFRVGLVADVDRATRHGHRVAVDGTFELRDTLPVRGVATSGWRGRSWSLGIADSVTVLAATAAAADAAATMVANAVNVEHPAIRRRPAFEVDDNTDLGRLAVTVDVAPLPDGAVEAALAAGARRAEQLLARGLAWGAVIVLQSRVRVVGGVAAAARLH